MAFALELVSFASVSWLMSHHLQVLGRLHAWDLLDLQRKSILPYLMSSVLFGIIWIDEAQGKNISTSSCYMDRYSPIDQERALSTALEVLSDGAQNIIVVYESAVFAKSCSHVECRTESEFNICWTDSLPLDQQRRKKAKECVCMWVGRVFFFLFFKKVVGDGTGRWMRGMGGDKDGCVKEEKEWILQSRAIIMQQLKHR